MSKMQDAASNVGAEGGEVCVDGPDGVAYSMSPDAANETGNRLIKGAAQAQSSAIQGKSRRPKTLERIGVEERRSVMSEQPGRNAGSS